MSHLNFQHLNRKNFAKVTEAAEAATIVVQFLQSQNIDTDMYFMENRTIDMAKAALAMNPPDEVQIAANSYIANQEGLV